MNETRLAALRCAIDIWSVQQQQPWCGETDDILRIAEQLENWLTRPQDRLILTASPARPTP